MDYRILEDYLQGVSCTAYEALGAHFSYEYDQNGVRFAVYAPNAARVVLIGDFNNWEGYEMQRLPNGVWTIFARDIAEGAMYKYRIHTTAGDVYDRADPFAFFSEVRPDTASIVTSLKNFAWTDEAWVARRDKNYNRPMSIYEVHAGSWKVKGKRGEEPIFYTYEELASLLIPYVKELGYTHIELLPLTEYPFDGSWGYQVTGYFSATSRYGSPHMLMSLINRCHEEGIGVILDFVPAHFVSDFYALHQYDGGFLYESDSQDQRYSEWGTVLFDYTKPHVVSFMKSALDFWLTCYHFDGIRYDAVSRLIYVGGSPEGGVNEAGVWFLKSANYALQIRHPGAMLIAEDSSNYLKVTAPVVYGGLGFDYKWDLGWMHDTTEYLAVPGVRRAGVHNTLTFSMSYFYQDIFVLPFSHDEVVHGKKTVIDKIDGTYDEKFSQLRTLYLYMFTHPGKKLNFMGNELAEFQEWNESKELGWNLVDYPKHRDFMHYFAAVQWFYRSQPALYREDYHPQSFEWLDVRNAAQSVFAYRRSDFQGNDCYVALNFSPRTAGRYRLTVDRLGVYEEVFGTDWSEFGGSGNTNGVLRARPQGAKCAIEVTLSPYSGYVFAKRPEDKEEPPSGLIR